MTEIQCLVCRMRVAQTEEADKKHAEEVEALKAEIEEADKKHAEEVSPVLKSGIHIHRGGGSAVAVW